MDEFVIAPKLGMLRYDKIFFETYYPVLFTCRDNEKKLFLCVCCQCNKDGKKWLLSKTTPDIIIKILKNKTTMREAFLVFKDVRLSIYWNKEKPYFLENDASDWDFEKSKSLPDAGEFIDADEDEFVDEIKYYQAILDELYSSIKIDKTIKSQIKGYEKTFAELYVDDSTSYLNEKCTLKSAILKKTVWNSFELYKEKPKPVLDISYNTPLFIGMSRIMKQINFADTRDEYTVCKKHSIYLSCAS